MSLGGMMTAKAARRRAVGPILAGAAAEALERRVLLSTFLVTTTADAGDGSVRSAILAADAAKAAATIAFDIPGAGVQTIVPLSALPAVTAAVTIDGTTQPGYAGTPLIALDGSSAGPAADGLNFTAPGSGAVGLDLENFSGNGIALRASLTVPKGNQFVRNCFIGTDPTGTLARGNGGDGILVTSSNATIGGGGGAGNLISAN